MSFSSLSLREYVFVCAFIGDDSCLAPTEKTNEGGNERKRLTGYQVQ